MTFYRARYDDGFKIGTRLNVIAYTMRSMVKMAKEGGSVEYAGQLSSVEVLQRGSHIIADDGQLTAYAVEPAVSISGVRRYYLKEAGIV